MQFLFAFSIIFLYFCFKFKKNKMTQENKPNEKKQELSKNSPKEIESSKTYFKCGTEESGILEIDLVTFRERGNETRYLAFKFSGIDARQDPPVPQEAFLDIANEEEFKKLKQFFSELNWRD